MTEESKKKNVNILRRFFREGFAAGQASERGRIVSKLTIWLNK